MLYFVVDAAVSVFIEERECLSKLLDLLLSYILQKHNKHYDWLNSIKIMLSLVAAAVVA